MRALWRLLQLIVGLVSGFLLGYAVVAWLADQDRRLRSAVPAGDGVEGSAMADGPAAGEGLLDKSMARLRLALDEGRRAAAAARAELEAELVGAAPPPRSGPAL